MRKLQAIERENARLKSEAEALAKVHSDIADLRSVKMAELAESSRQSGAKAWLARMELLQHAIELNPSAAIPEFKLLDENDWLSASKNPLETDEDYRKAFAALRNTAEMKFILHLQGALKAYMAENKNFPFTVHELAPYFEMAPDPAALNRYRVADSAEVPNVKLGGEKIITQVAPVDEEYDQLRVLGPYGQGATTFKKAKTVPPGIESALKEYSLANDGRIPSSPQELLPYLKTPEDRAAFQKLMEENGPKK